MYISNSPLALLLQSLYHSSSWNLQIERIAHVAFQLAQKRKKRLCSVDNVLEVSQLWREVVTSIGEQYPDVELTHMCAFGPCPDHR